MHLLASLNAGFLGAANGTASIYIRGTNTRATWYASFEGDGPNSSGADITLDAYGSALAYVNQLVDVVIKDADGVSVRDYGDGYASPNIEIDSQSFTGTDYTGGGSAADKPTTLQAIADLWKTNNGAIDWKVLFAGAATTLQVALGGLNGLVYNVKSPAYGAVGDGTTDDLTAIQAALAAAVAAGGGVVFFPAGSFLISDTITWDYRVHAIFMPGAQLLINSAAAKTIKFTAANATLLTTVFYGATFGAAQVNTGVAVSIESSQKLYFEKCVFGVSSNTSGTLIQITSGQVSTIVHDCEFYLTGTTANAIGVTTGSPGYLLVRDNKFVTPATYNDTVISVAATSAYHGAFEGNIFDGLTNSTVTAGTNMCIRPSAFGDHVYTDNLFLGAFSYALFLESPGRVAGNEFKSSVVAIAIDGLLKVRAENNAFTSVTTRYNTSGGTLPAGAYLELDKYEVLFSNTTTPTFGADTEFTEFVSNTTVPTCAMSNGYYAGQPKKILFRNTSGGNWVSVAFSGASVNRVTSLAALDVNAAAMKMTSWIWTDPITAGTYVWLKYAEA